MSSYPNGITQELISAAQQLLFAMAYERHVGPIVIDYETEILKLRKPDALDHRVHCNVTTRATST